MFTLLIEFHKLDKKESEIIKELSQNKDFAFLIPEITEIDTIDKKDFTTETKSAAFLRDALKNPLRCAICKGLIHKNSITVDHIERKQDGGLGNIENAQLAHPYCNTTYKN